MSAAEPLVLVVEDELPLRRFLRTALSSHGYRMEEAPTLEEARRLAPVLLPEIVLLDLGLPDGDGMDLLRELKAGSPVPIIVLSARGREEDKVRALDLGADDYLSKPFGTAELLARLRVALRHAAALSGAKAEPTLDLDGLHIDFANHEVKRGGEVIHLTPNEYALLAALARHAGKVLTHRQLLREVWGGSAAAQPHYLRVCMAGLRRKLEQDPARPRYLLTEQGVGYRFRES